MTGDGRPVRMVRLLLDVASKKGWTVRELAGQYGVSQRTLQRDIKELERLRVRLKRDEEELSLEPSGREQISMWMGIDPRNPV